MTNLEIIRQFQYALWDEKNLNVIDKFFDREALIHSPVASTQGTERMKEIIRQWYTGFPDLKVFWDDFICEEDKVVSRWHAEGVHQGDFSGYPPSNHTIHYSGVTIYQLRHGKIRQYWAFVDMQTIWKQLTGSTITG
ncbi:ester cyclase [Legionella spiritensis]|uniref:ester cyclase n=1 Tax=Legionella spiritensis TaxID=452 RepID=UPI000F6FD930|nr:ester cyclase [Legionella spiritensis]VEG90930.1 Predicted ester cyclase [Legionella spiritensis]